MTTLFHRIHNNKYCIYLYRILLPVLVALACYAQLELSSSFTDEAYRNAQHIYKMQPQYILLNVLSIIAVISIMFLFVRRLWIASLITAFLCFALAFANYYTIKYRGTPASPIDLKLLGTATDVVASYKFHLDRYVLAMMAALAANIALCLIGITFKCKPKISLKQVCIRDLFILCLATSFFYFTFFHKQRFPVTEDWSWIISYHKYGYMLCSVPQFATLNSRFEPIVPTGYSAEKVAMIEQEFLVQNFCENESPDIILILNESYFDIAQIHDLETDVAYMENYHSLSNAIRGFTVVPNGGSGTNNTEYELLTGNSLQLMLPKMPSIVPFYVLDNHTNSIVSLLNSLGYHSIGAHPASAGNYNRINAYSELGFHQSLFLKSFQTNDTGVYAKREYMTDISAFNNVISWYESMPQDRPRFIYLLTIQNHGDWNHNQPEDALVRSKTDFGKYQDTVNEFLSCMKLTDDALLELVNYLKSVKRNVILCMNGDHAPIFARKITDPTLSQDEKELRLRLTPFIIWANFEIESREMGNISTIYLVPTLLQAAKVQRPPYYQYMLDLKEKVPILSSYGVYYDTQGNRFTYEDITEYTEEINKYFFLEYNLLQNKEKRNPWIFQVNETSPIVNR
jgi:hypothetical protein